MNETREKIEAALKLMSSDSTSFDKFESIAKLVRGADPRVDKALEKCAKAILSLKRLQEGDYITLSVQSLPEGTEKEKKRKKALLWFIKTYNELKDEIERIKKLTESEKSQEKTNSLSQAATFVKGPFGIVTIAALVIMGGYFLFQSNKSEDNVLVSPSPIESLLPSASPKAKYILYMGKQIALSQLAVREGQDCDSSHYHAANGSSVVTLDGEAIADPGSCAFGREKETQVFEK